PIAAAEGRRLRPAQVIFGLLLVAVAATFILGLLKMDFLQHIATVASAGLLALGLFTLVYEGASTGRLQARGGGFVERNQDAKTFWTLMVLYSVAGSGMALGTVYFLLHLR